MPEQPDHYSSALAENLLTILAHDNRYGRLVLGFVEPEQFDNEIHRTLATRIADYWRRYQKAPGKVHTADLVADIIEDPQNQRGGSYRDVLTAMLITASSGINPDHVLDEVKAFKRMVALKRLTLNTARQLSSRGHIAIPEMEQAWTELLSSRSTEFERGMGLDGYEQVLDYFNNKAVEFSTGIKPFDKGRIVPVRGAVMIFLAPSGYGKTWFAVHLGKRAFVEHKKVLHVTLGDLSEEEVLGRYYQALFAVPKHRVPDLQTTVIDRNEFGRFLGTHEEPIEATFHLSAPEAGAELEAHLSSFGARIENLIVKGFPSLDLTIDRLNAYLDHLEIVEQFVPDLLILDYLGELKTEGSGADDRRVGVGTAFKQLRRTLEQRGIAGFVPHQVNRKGMEVATVLITHTAEDISLIQTADFAITMSATPAERRRRLARLWVNKGRAEKDNFGALITQNYDIGQFCIEAVKLDSSYFEFLETIRSERAERRTPDESSQDDDDGE